MKHKKTILSVLLFVGALSFSALKAESATRQDVQGMRYHTINTICQTTRTDCLLRQNHILNQFDQNDPTDTGRTNRSRIPNGQKQAQTTANTSTKQESTASSYEIQTQSETSYQYEQQNNEDTTTQTSTSDPQTNRNQQTGIRHSGTHHGLRDGSGGGRNGRHCY